MTNKTLFISTLILFTFVFFACKKDKTNPEIIIKGANPMYLNLGDTYIEPGAEATDDKDEDISSKIKISHSVNPKLVDEYIVEYMVSDKAGNTSHASRKVNVKALNLKGTYFAKSTAKEYEIKVVETSTFNRIVFRNFANYGNQNLFYSKINGNSFIIDNHTFNIGTNAHRFSNAKGYYSAQNSEYK
ncbi:MAG: DUF5011 domain-containing protein, partial [Bacteroidales bacterium]|nr:DUF5011 domain-containing protein [Bacteroidales bacterium]MDD4760004.1 DUF5011 domain-containing protein [Bacteroidaceae bacterium]